MMVTYARTPATLSVSPAAAGATAAAPCTAPPAHFGQLAPSTICVPQVGQKATGPPLRDERQVIRTLAATQWRCRRRHHRGMRRRPDDRTNDPEMLFGTGEFDVKARDGRW